MMGRVKELYPDAPGWKEPATSRDAAKAVAGRTEHLRDRVLTAIRNAGPKGLTADEAASRIGETPFAVRPRLTELAKSKKIERTMERRKNASGVAAAVWRSTDSLFCLP
jgi:predicted ArsR family transcriptional regulator